MTGMREQAVLLGPRKALVGIVSQGAADANATAIVILNAGILHRVGPNRMFVTLARRLAAAGHTVVRFDLSGIGDSEVRTDAVSRNDGLELLHANLADIREVLDSLEQTRQVRNVILVGLCSGADHAVIYSGDDPRVKGIVIIDPSIPHTRRYHLNYLRDRVFRLSSWRNLTSARHPFWHALRRKLNTGATDKDDRRPDLQSDEVRAFLENAYAKACAADLNFLAVFTSDLEAQHNYREQVLDAFPRVPLAPKMQLEYFDTADHTFTGEGHRESLLQLIVNWIATQRRTSSANARVVMLLLTVQNTFASVL